MNIGISPKEKLHEFDKMGLPTVIAICIEFCTKIALFGMGLEILDSSTASEHFYRTCFRYLGTLNLALAWTLIFKYPINNHKMRIYVNHWSSYYTQLDYMCEYMFVMGAVDNTRISHTLVIARSFLVIVYALAQYANIYFTIYKSTHLSNSVFGLIYIINTVSMIWNNRNMLYKLLC